MAAIASDPGAIGSIQTAKNKAANATPKLYGGTIDNYISAAGLEPKPVAAPVVAPVAEAAPVAAPPIDWKKLIEEDPERKLQQGYLDRDNTMTTAALRKAWLQHSQSSMDSFNAHGGLFSGAMAQAQDNAKDDYNDASARQQLTYDKGGHDLNTSVEHRLIKLFTGVDNGLGT